MKALGLKHLKKLKTIFLSLNNTFFIYFFILLILLFLKNNLYLVIPLVVILYIYKKYINIKILMVFFLLFLVLILINYLLTNYLINFNIYFVVEKKKNFIIVSNIFSKYIIYNTNYDVYDILLIKNFSFKNQISFINLNPEFKFYIEYKNINGLLYKVNSIKKLFSFNIFYLKKYIEYYIAYFPDNTKDYLNMIFLNIKNKEIKELYSFYGISYLLSLSGFHIYFLINISNKILYFFSIEKEKQFKVNLFILIFLLFNFYSFVVLRILIFFILKYINNEYELRFNKISLLTLTFTILLIIPNIYNHLSFQISFLVLFFYYLGIENRKYLTNFKTNLYNNIVLFLCLLPFFINISNGVNLFVIMFSMIISIILKKSLIPLLYLSFIFYPFSFINEYILIGFESMLIYFKKYNLTFKLSPISIYYLFIYYLLLIYILSNYKCIKKYLIITFISLNLLIINNYSIFDKIYIFKETFTNSFFINESFNKNNISINPGINQINYLLKNNKKIDYLIMSNNYIDEKVTELIIKNFKVKKIITNNYFKSYKTTNLERYYKINDISFKFYFSKDKYLKDEFLDYEININNLIFFISDKYIKDKYYYFQDKYSKYYNYLIINDYNPINYKFHLNYSKKIKLTNTNSIFLIYTSKKLKLEYNFKFNIFLL